MSLPALRSPASGELLAADTPHSLREASGRRWPVIDGIAFLRVGREALARDALACLDAGDAEGALVLLLADQDDWWTGPQPAPDDLRHLVRDRDRLSLRDAMALLAFGRVGDYFAHRWSDPTFLAGLGLLEAHWRPAASAFELACGIGHFGRELLGRGVAYTGADVVFAKLWLARWWVLDPGTPLVCFDAAQPWPVADQSFDLALCQDAFYFLEPKTTILAGLRGLVAPNGWMAVGHIHNRGADNLSAGAALEASDVAALFPDGVVYDDAELTRALIESRAPRPEHPEALRHVEAFSVAAGPGLVRSPRALTGGLAMPPRDAPLRLNPLFRDLAHGAPSFDSGPSAPAQDGGAVRDLWAPAQDEKAWEVAWPSERYRAEYEARATYPLHFSVPDTPDGMAAAIRCRALVALPERW